MKKRKFELNSIILFVFMMGANVCNYLFQIIIGGMLSVEDYGTVNTLLSIIVYFTIPNSIIGMIAARYIALYNNMDNEGNVLSVLKLLLKCGMVIMLIIATVGAVFAGVIANVFNLDSKYLVMGCALIAIFSVGVSVMSGTLQGMQMFTAYGIQGILPALCKLVGSIVLVALGYRIWGVIAAMTIGAILTMIYCVIYIRKKIVKAIRYKGDSIVDVYDFIKVALGIIVAQSCITALTNGDILLVKALFSDTEAGTYSSAMVIGKIAMYVATAVVAALFPMVVEEHNKGNSTAPLFAKALFYGGGASVLMALGMNILGKYVIGVLFGEKYLAAIGYLPAVCAFVVPLTFLTIIMNYVIAINKVRFFALSILASSVVMLTVVSIFHVSIIQVMTLCGAALTVDAIINLIYCFRQTKGYKREEMIDE